MRFSGGFSICQAHSALEQELERHPDKTASAQWAIELLASGRYKRYLTTTKKDKIRIDRAAIRDAQRYDGKRVLETNDDTNQSGGCRVRL